MGNSQTQEQIQNKIQDQSDFEHWKMLGNQLSLDAITNQDKIAWPELEANLLKSLQFYDKTLGFDVIYADCQQPTPEEKEQIMKLMQQQSYYGFSYPEEMLRISKNKAICLKALIINGYQ